MELPEYRALTAAVGTTAARQLARQWGKPGLWEDRIESAALLLTVGQLRAAELAEVYAASQLGAVDVAIDASAFAGVASDGRSLSGLLVGAQVAADSAASAEEARRAGSVWLQMATLTQIADAGRAALRTSMAVRDSGGVRVASPPCCGRCAVLNGRFYSWQAAFPRHPRCDCTYSLERRGDELEAPDDVPLDQIRGLSQADRRAIEMGADLNQVVNAHRGMTVANVHGVTVKATSEGMTKRGLAYKRMVRARAERLGIAEDAAARRTARLMPESILNLATDSEDAIRLLKLHGYII